MSDPQFVLLGAMPPTGHDPEPGEQQNKFFMEMPILNDAGKNASDYLTDRARQSQAEKGLITRAYVCIRQHSVIVEAFYKAE